MYILRYLQKTLGIVSFCRDLLSIAAGIRPKCLQKIRNGKNDTKRTKSSTRPNRPRANRPKKLRISV